MSDSVNNEMIESEENTNLEEKTELYDGFDPNQVFELSEEEERLLTEEYIGDARIKEGKLFSFQYEGLKQLRFARSYLEEKYPNTDFYITVFAPISNNRPIATVTFYVDGNDEAFFDLELEANDEGYSARDNYYGAILREEYDEALERILKDEVNKPFKVYTELYQLKGSEINGDTTAEELISLKNNLSRRSYLFFNEEDLNAEELVEELRTYCTECGLYGSYTVYYAEELLTKYRNSEELYKLICSPAAFDIKRLSFNCFDVE